MKKVKIIQTYYSDDLELKINNFISYVDCFSIDIQVTQVNDFHNNLPTTRILLTALIGYEELGNE